VSGGGLVAAATQDDQARRSRPLLRVSVRIAYLVRYLELPRCMFVTTFRDTDSTRPGAPSNGPTESPEARLDLL
jgi:hypothetical protein